MKYTSPKKQDRKANTPQLSFLLNSVQLNPVPQTNEPQSGNQT